jgi:hypothetical protein
MSRDDRRGQEGRLRERQLERKAARCKRTASIEEEDQKPLEKFAAPFFKAWHCLTERKNLKSVHSTHNQTHHMIHVFGRFGCQYPKSESPRHTTAYVYLRRVSYVAAKEHISLVAITLGSMTGSGSKHLHNSTQWQHNIK